MCPPYGYVLLWASAAETMAQCSFGDTVSDDGKRRLAVIVGVTTYPYLEKADLAGPENDARLFYELLTNPTGFRFPEENVCLLLNDQATQDSVVNAFEEGLIANARQDDVAVFYFAGHGGQRKDLGGDETDGRDGRQALNVAVAELAPPNVAVPMNNLAQLYKRQGAYAQADQTNLNALEIAEQSLGRSHPLVGTILSIWRCPTWLSGTRPRLPLYLIK
jgi:hypothetical protein